MDIIKTQTEKVCLVGSELGLSYLYTVNLSKFKIATSKRK